jgi:heme exporter protein D
MELGPHASFIWAAYAITALVVAALLSWLLMDGKRQRAALRDLEARGVKRRSAQDSNGSAT